MGHEEAAYNSSSGQQQTNRQPEPKPQDLQIWGNGHLQSLNRPPADWQPTINIWNFLKNLKCK